jgi:hypothetical protein
VRAHARSEAKSIQSKRGNTNKSGPEAAKSTQKISKTNNGGTQDSVRETSALLYIPSKDSFHRGIDIPTHNLPIAQQPLP